MKLKLMALAAAIGLSAMAVQANELPNGPHVCDFGDRQRSRCAGYRHPAIEVNVAAKDAASAKSRPTIAWRSISLSSKERHRQKRY